MRLKPAVEAGEGLIIPGIGYNRSPGLRWYRSPMKTTTIIRVQWALIAVLTFACLFSVVKMMGMLRDAEAIAMVTDSAVR